MESLESNGTLITGYVFMAGTWNRFECTFELSEYVSVVFGKMKTEMSDKNVSNKWCCFMV